ncbi:hypothetical protein Tco_1140670 [Tanacetum coccineum]
MNNVLSKPVTPHYLPKVRESALAKPHHVNAPSSSRNSKEESYGSNDIAHNYYLEEAKKMTQDKNRNLKPREMPSAKTHHTPNAYHSRNPSSILDFKHFVCSTCQICVFNANHDSCITKFLKEVNSRAKIQPNKIRNSNKPVDPTSHTQKPGRKIVTGHSFSPNKSSAVHEKTNTPRSCLRWIPTGRIFNTAGLKWVLTGKTFTSSTTKVDCEPPNGSNDYITNPYKCDQTLNVSAGSLNLSAGPAPQRKEECTLQCALSSKEEKSSCILSRFESFGCTISITWWKRHLVISQYASFESPGGSVESIIIENVRKVLSDSINASSNGQSLSLFLKEVEIFDKRGTHRYDDSLSQSVFCRKK